MDNKVDTHMPQDHKYPNANMYVLILAAEEVLGQNGFASVLNQGQLTYMVGKYPPNNMDMEVPFSLYGQVQQAIEDFYGPRGSKAILMRVGRALFRYTLKEQSALLGLASVAMKALPTTARQKMILSKFVSSSTDHFSMPTEMRETGDAFIISRTACPCQFRKRNGTSGVCDHVTIGTLQEATKWATDNMYTVEQTQCLNIGDAIDEFVVSKMPQ